jgi:transcriptional regulator with XRE-family HTH domain
MGLEERSWCVHQRHEVRGDEPGLAVAPGGWSLLLPGPLHPPQCCLDQVPAVVGRFGQVYHRRDEPHGVAAVVLAGVVEGRVARKGKSVSCRATVVAVPAVFAQTPLQQKERCAMMQMVDVFEDRLLTAKEIGAVIAMMRDARGWTQETLAEISRVNVRTVQRVESGGACSVDTRRALAGALDWDLDTFDKPWSLPNADRLKAEQDKLERETIAIKVTPVTSGRHLRELAELAEGWQHNQLTDLTPIAEEIFAEMQEYFQDYGDINDCYSPSQKLEVNRDLQRMIDLLLAEGVSISAGTRRLRFGKKDDKDAIIATVVHVVAGRTEEMPNVIRAPRKTSVSL